MPFVQHPTFPDIVKEVTTAEVKDWTDAGWKRVAKAEEDKASLKAEAGQ